MDGRQSRSLEGLDDILVKIYQSLFHNASFVDDRFDVSCDVPEARPFDQLKLLLLRRCTFY